MSLAVACGTSDSGGTGEPKSPAKQTLQPAPKALLEKIPKPECRLLEDPSMRRRLSAGLERKLLSLCGQAPRVPRTAAAPQTPAPAGDHARLAALPGGDIPVNDPALDVGGSTQSETSTAAFGNVVCVAWNDAGEGFGSNGFAGFGYSLDGGQTFQDGGPFPSGGGDLSFGDPSLAYSVRDGAFYFASLSNAGLSLWRSTSSCQSFEYVGPIHEGFGDDKELMAVDNNPSSPYYGRIHVGWTDFAAPGDINVAAYSDDGGDTWSAPSDFPGSGSNGQGVYPAVAPNGDVFMALVNRGFELGDHQDQWLYRSTDGGDSWTKVADIGTDQLQPEDDESTNDCGRQALNGHVRNLSSPQIVITADASVPSGYVIHAVYPYDSDGEDGPDHSNVFYRQSSDGGDSWSPELQLNDDGTNTDQFYPNIGASEDGLLAVSFYDRRLDTLNNLLFDRFLTISLDGGATFSPNERISDESSPVAQTLPNFDGLAQCYHGDYDQIAVAGNLAHIVWSDDRRVTESGPNPDVYYDQFVINPRHGRLTATQSAVSCAGTIGFSLSDSDLAGAGTYAITLSTTTSDTETLTLVESADRPGKFSGSIATSAGAATPDSGVLEVSDGAVITATYEDADDGSGNPATVTLDVQVDCSPPVVTDVRVAELTGSTATIAVNSSEPASLKAEYGFACNSLGLSATGKASATPSVAITELYAGFTYYYAVVVTDLFGNSVRDDNGGNCYTFKTLDIIYQQNFESGLDGWEIPPNTGSGGFGGSGGFAGEATGGSGGTGAGGRGSGGTGAAGRGSAGTAGVSSTGGTGTAGAPDEGGAPGTAGEGGSAGGDDQVGGGLWHLSQACATVAVGHTRPSALYYGQDATCTFDVGYTRGVALSPPITLADAEFATVEFDYYLGTEGGGFYDRASLEVSVNGGPFEVVASNFTSLAKPDPDEPSPFRTREGAEPAGRYALLENTEKWQHSVSDLAPFLTGLETATIQLRLQFDTIDGAVNDFAGFYVDDVKVFGVLAAVPCADSTTCDDGVYCNGTEACQGGFCAKGLPVVCSGGDDVACTTFACDETTHACAEVPHDELCDNGEFCDGEEHCDPSAGCQAGTPVTCQDGDVSCVVGQCEEDIKTCRQLPDNTLCDDGKFCTGYDYCDPSLGCQTSGPPCVDGVNCTTDLCDEETFSCSFPPNDSLCNDGLFCDGQEYCDVYQGCRSTGPACGPADRCDEGGDQCLPICFTDTNAHHQTAGRAYTKRTAYYASGSNDSLGKATQTTSLQGSGNYWKKVPSCPAPPSVDGVNVAVSGDTVTVSGSASDPNGDLLKVRLTFYLYLYTPTSFDAVGTTSFQGAFSLPPGVHAVSVQAYDQAGFVSPVAGPFYFEILQPQPPTIDSVAVTVNQKAVTVAGTASDPNDDITQVVITILKDGNVVASAVATGLTAWSGTVPGLAPGSYTARAQAFDSFGFTSVLTEPIPFVIADTGLCIEDTNGHHKTAGRATLEQGTYYAVGSHDSLGRKASTVTALSGSVGNWHKVNDCP